MREMVIQFMNELGEDFDLRNDTVGQAMGFFDRVLSRKPVDKSHVQLLAVACVLVAAKFGERRMPALADLEYVCQGKYSAADVKAAETDVVSTLSWQLHAITPHMFCTHLLLSAVKCPARASCVFRHVEFFVDLSFYVYEALDYTSCLVGAAALLCSQEQIRLGLHAAQQQPGPVCPSAPGQPAVAESGPELGLLLCAELAPEAIASQCGFDLEELRGCQALLLAYFERHFLSPHAQQPEAGPGAALLAEAEAEADCESEEPLRLLRHADADALLAGPPEPKAHDPDSRATPDNVIDYSKIFIPISLGDACADSEQRSSYSP